MARRIVHQLVDDIDGTVLEPGDGETVHFALDGTAYEIDLTEDNAAALRRAFEPFLAAGRSISTSRSSATSGGSSSRGRTRRRSGQQDYGPIREWARQNGHEVSERGRVPAAVIDAYNDAH